MTTAERRLEQFITKYDPAVAAQGRAALVTMRTILPGAVELVYDNYNALAVGFCASERTSDAILSIALYPRWVTLFFLHGARLVDSDGLLRGAGKRVRSIVLDAAGETLDDPRVRALIAQALATSPAPIDDTQPNRIVIKSVSAKQRPRRPTR